MKILLAVDGSECSDAAVKEIAHRPWPVGTVMKVFSVVELPFAPTTETWALPDSYYTQLEESGRERAQAAIEKSVKTLREEIGMVLEIITDIKMGHAATTIIDEAESWRADLLIIGSHGYRGFKRFLLGSVSTTIASHAKCSVEIIRTRPVEESEK